MLPDLQAVGSSILGVGRPIMVFLPPVNTQPPSINRLSGESKLVSSCPPTAARTINSAALFRSVEQEAITRYYYPLSLLHSAPPPRPLWLRPFVYYGEDGGELWGVWITAISWFKPTWAVGCGVAIKVGHCKGSRKFGSSGGGVWSGLGRAWSPWNGLAL